MPNIAIFQWRVFQLFAEAEGCRKYDQIHDPRDTDNTTFCDNQVISRIGLLFDHQVIYVFTHIGARSAIVCHTRAGGKRREFLHSCGIGVK